MNKERVKETIWIKEPGLGYRVDVSYLPHWMDFKAYRIVATEIDGGNPHFQMKDRRGEMDLTDDVEKAEPIEGFIKWDGCCEVSRDGNPHFCGMDGVREEFAMMEALYKIASEKLTSFDRDCAGMR